MDRTKLTYLIILSLSFILFASEAPAQSKKRLRELEKTEEQQKQDEEKAIEEAKERHMSIQSKETKKRMKKLERKNKRLNKNRREPFWKRWFTRKGRSRKSR